MRFLTRSTQCKGLTQARPDQQSGCFLIGFIKICGNIEDESIGITIRISVDDFDSLTARRGGQIAIRCAENAGLWIGYGPGMAQGEREDRVCINAS
jgi:hypothetical protein